MIGADGSNQIKFTNNSAGDYRPSWSPDGSKIALDRFRLDGSYEIYVMDADGYNQTRLTDKVQGYDYGYSTHPFPTSVWT